ncbi:MAG: hypothetical protein ACKE9I_00445 [Methylophagaceae bacterium]
MAENDVDESADDVILEDGEAAESGDSEVKKIAGIAVPLLIKIAIGLAVVMIGAGAYFFFFMQEEPSESQETREQDAILEQGSMATDPAEMVMQNESPKFEDIMKGLPGNEDMSTETEEVAVDEEQMADPTAMPEEGEGGEAVVKAGETLGTEDETEALKQRISELEAQVEQKNKNLTAEQRRLDSSLAVDNFITSSPNEFGDFQSISDTAGPVPEPMWGDFDRYKYQKKKP